MQLMTPDGHDVVIKRMRETSKINLRVDHAPKQEGAYSLVYAGTQVGYFNPSTHKIHVYQPGSDTTGRGMAIDISERESRTLRETLDRMRDGEEFEETMLAEVETGSR